MVKAPQTIMLGQSQVTEKHSHFSSQREESQKSEIEIELITKFDDLYQMTLIGLHVRQYMYVLFDKVQIYIKQSQRVMFSSSKNIQ
jgi:hypothetical protein